MIVLETNDILELIRSVALFRKNYVTFMNKKLSSFDITTSEFAYLKEVIHCNGIAQDELIRNLSIDKAAATRIAQSLEKKDLINRIKNENNKRFFNVFLTEKGNTYVQLTQDYLKEFHNTAFKGISASEFESFKKTLKQINNNF